MEGIVTMFLLGVASCVEPKPADSLEVWVRLVDMTGLNHEVVASLQHEVDTIYRPAGVAIRWLSDSPEETAPHVARVYLLDSLPGSLHRRLHTFNGAPPMALGLGHEGGVSGAVIYVSRRGVIAQATNGSLVEPAPEVFARALGRVISHELAHPFLQREHTRQGILKADFSSADLVGDGSWARFTKREAEGLRALAFRASGNAARMR